MTQDKRNKETMIDSKSAYFRSLTDIQDIFITFLKKRAYELSLNYDSYQINCAKNMLAEMSKLLCKEGLNFSQINKDNVIEIIQTAAVLRLDPLTNPKEIFVALRNSEATICSWQRVFEIEISGDGEDRLLSEYGVGVSRVHNCWMVCEGDEFYDPSFDGTVIYPPIWKPQKYSKKVIKIVYPIEMVNGTIEYYLSDREDVVDNLRANIFNNLMKIKIITEQQKKKIIEQILTMDMEGIFADDSIMNFTSMGWRSVSGREALIILKMRNNAIKKIPKDFKDSFVEMIYERVTADENRIMLSACPVDFNSIDND